MGVIAPNAYSLVQRHLGTVVSGFGRLRSPHVPGSSHSFGMCAAFTVWAVVPLLMKEV